MVAAMPETQANGIRIYYEELGEGAPILLIHGASSSAAVWGRAVDELAQLGRVIAYDRRGCWRSERPEPYDVTNVGEHADDAAALLEALDAVPAIVIGRSYGGETAIDLALRYPERVRALVLLEAALLLLSPEAKALNDDVGGRVRAAAEQDMELVGEVFIRAVLGDPMWEGFPEELRQMFTFNGPAILAEFRGGPLDVSLDDLSRIAVPTLLVAATDSPQPFRDVTEMMAGAIPNSRTSLVGGTHFVNPAEPSALAFVREQFAQPADRAT